MNSLLHSAKFKNSLLACSTLAALLLITIAANSPAADWQILLLRAPHNNGKIENDSKLPRTAQFMAVGDIMLSRTVADKMVRHGFGYPFVKVHEVLAQSDFVFGNLETPITNGPRVEAGQMIFRADPGVEQAMKDAIIRIVSLANNHSPNFGSQGLLDTFAYLEAVGITYVGAGDTAAKARQAQIITSNGIKIAFLAYTDTDVIPSSYEAGETHPGVAIMDTAFLAPDITAVNDLADIVVVSMHSGTEYAPTPNPRQTSFARAAIDAGADLVIGHHPHVVQTLEEYRGKLIIYSLGNFIFDQMWSVETRQGLLAMISCSSDGIESLGFIPIMIDDYSQARPANDEEAQLIFKRLGTEVTLDSAFRWYSIDF